MFTTILLIISLIILAILALYAMAYIILLIQQLIQLNTDQPLIKTDSNSSVRILIPSHHEGEALGDTLETLINQSYEGKIIIDILLKDSNDNSLQFLQKKFDFDSNFVFHKKNREVNLVFTNVAPKKDKINYGLQRNNEDFLAFLDADHRAHPEWIKSSLAMLKKQNADAIQGTRAPLDARGLFQFWDSAENHIGNEIVNQFFQKLGLTSFFTGTTCIFKSESFSHTTFPDCLTEDTFISYDLICSGKKIIFNSNFGSYEEVSPDMATFISRKRRWANGHNHAFFHHLGSILTSKFMGALQKIQLLFHGAFFILPLLIVGLLNTYGLFNFFQLTTNIQYFICLLTLLLSLFFAKLVSFNWKDFFYNYIFSLTYIFPQLAIFSVLIYKINRDEIYFQLISFPYELEFVPIHITLLALPLVFLFIGIIKKNIGALKYFLLYLVTYPFILFLNIFSCYIGFWDFIFKKKSWGVINRSFSLEEKKLPPELLGSLSLSHKVKNKYWFYASLVVIPLFVVLGNDFLAEENCGHPTYFLTQSILFERDPSDVTVDLIVKKRKHVSKENLFIIDSKIKLKNPKGKKLELKVFRNNQIIKDQVLSKTEEIINLNFTEELGFEHQTMSLSLKGPHLSCQLNHDITTNLISIENGKIYLNNEPFLIKGIVSSYNSRQSGLDLEDFMKQIKQIGVNALRVYHSPTPNQLALAKKYSIMLIVQPNESTWDNINMKRESSIKKLYGRYRDMENDTDSSPYILIRNVGNELELKDDTRIANENIKKVIKKIKKDDKYRFPLSYSTYLVYDNYPVDLLAVNMLDTGNVYWQDGLSLLQKKFNAFYASEFGGFVAFTERTPQNIRINRIYQQWYRILNAGGSGGVFFQSHDNWSQPVATGYNDPFSPEQPDDLRGIWDNKNQPKRILKHIKNIYSDLSIRYKSSENLINFIAQNIRNYHLHDLQISHNGLIIYNGDVAPQKEISFKINKNINQKTINLDLSYKTHKGLSHTNTIEITNPLHIKEPFIINRNHNLKVFGQNLFQIEVSNEDKNCFLSAKVLEKILF